MLRQEELQSLFMGLDTDNNGSPLVPFLPSPCLSMRTCLHEDSSTWAAGYYAGSDTIGLHPPRLDLCAALATTIAG